MQQSDLVLQNVTKTVLLTSITRFMRKHTPLQKTLGYKNLDPAILYLWLTDATITLTLPSETIVYDTNWTTKVNSAFFRYLTEARKQHDVKGLMKLLNRSQSLVSTITQPDHQIQSLGLLLEYLRLLGIDYTLTITKPLYGRRGDSLSDIAYKASTAIGIATSTASSVTDYIRRQTNLTPATLERIRRCKQTIIDKPMDITHVITLCMDLGLTVTLVIDGSTYGVFTSPKQLVREILGYLDTHPTPKGVERLVLPDNNFRTEVIRSAELPLFRIHRYFYTLNIPLHFYFTQP